MHVSDSLDEPTIQMLTGPIEVKYICVPPSASVRLCRLADML